ncbi:hypothetical protein ARALYDRAFT_338398 [Arabidopsis lyrata subsp. lyrata]|uniref:Cullin N-terminal domain-containing protein n=1 Tax=Arabidopsis lyrata subsp. lyrata TaxID=81972 RepID=D7KXR3_ARALL|nr:hypothetical protein ARALYDRAFT_338398 [Arabidopsis lyrata subsp. lyrata]
MSRNKQTNNEAIRRTPGGHEIIISLHNKNYSKESDKNSAAKLKTIGGKIHKEREGEQIDRELVRNIINVYVENGMGSIKQYEEDFESFMLQDTASYYFSKASRWIEEDSCPDYTLKAYLYISLLGLFFNLISRKYPQECLQRERERVTHYLHPTTEPKLFKVLKEAFQILKRNGGSEKLK